MNLNKRLSFDRYLMLGTYIGNARTICFEKYGPYNQYSEPMAALNPDGLFRPNGFFLLPHFKFGIAIRTKVN